MIEKATVIFLAAASSNEVVKADPAKALITNTSQLLGTVQEIVKYRPAQIIFASSEWVYASDENGKLINDIVKNESAYGRQKVAGEIIVRDICETNNIPYFNARFGIVWGNRRRGSAVESVIQMVFDSNSPDAALSVGHVKSARRFIHIDDLVDELLMISPRDTGTYDITGTEAISILDVATSASEVLGRRLNVLSVNKYPSIRLLTNSDIRQHRLNKNRDSFRERVKNHINNFYLS
jgi:nucleoside-diphosphate-sugar epimerase